MSTTEIVKAFFSDGSDVPAGGDVRIDVLDSWTNVGFAAVIPSTGCICDSRYTSS